MKKISTIIFGLFAAATLQEATAQTLQTNTDLYLQPGSTLFVQGNMVNNAASSGLINNGTLSITGNLVNNQLVNTNSGTLVFSGSAAQVLSGTATYNANNFEVNNAAGLTLSNKLTIGGIATFTNGIVSAPTQTNSMEFTTTSGSLSGVKDASHVNGYVSKAGTGTFTFPVGNGTKYQGIAITRTGVVNIYTVNYVAGNAGAGTFTTTGSKATPLAGYNSTEYWNIESAPSSNTYTFNILWDGTNDSYASVTPNVRRVARKVGGNWLNEGGTGTGTTTAGSVTSNAISLPSSTTHQITMGWEDQVLPLSWLNVNATDTKDQKVQVQWQVSESNVTTYIVERNTGAGFIEIATVASKGNGNNSYTLADAVRSSGSIYYRIKQIDQDGTSSYSDVFDVRIASNGKLAVYPNPVIINLAIDSDKKQDAKIYNVQGQQVKVLRLVEGINNIDLGYLPSGVYFLRTADGEVTKLIKAEK
ncbi:T9SS type A sorting domain-containing protein [Pedobacter xixiisoli]|uniref:Por secretion system C-terminal sorting domain-containing protein n=1 Tax=Pedobacter xixiisoli TaxID=1476464 RepID=A0A286AE82_9SPHI|nr:T9SS type A sorting domain-containing protein [Pedobacter xixiisoli]SOD20213.1 Por secretion system C-terminal sorting domain-containing protein [Pedobacter xixiisoli]